MSGVGGSGSDLANLLQNNVNKQPQNPKLSDNLQINLKLNSQNYALWTRMIRVAIGGRSKTLLSHLTTNPPTQSSFKKPSGPWIFDCGATDTMTYEDIKTRRIIRRGTEREGLYYVDDVTTSGTVMLAHEKSKREVWSDNGVLSDTQIGGPMATKRIPKVPKPRKKRFLPTILAPSTKKAQVMAGDQMVVLED
ncbi:hypothetical protein Tco_1336779 [Tanacetum coccineum]